MGSGVFDAESGPHHRLTWARWTF